MICPNCKSEASVLLIDCALPLGEERDRVRYCRACKPESIHEHANTLPQILARLGLPGKELKAASAARRYVADRQSTYSLAERLIDLSGPVGKRTQ